MKRIQEGEYDFPSKVRQQSLKNKGKLMKVDSIKFKCQLCHWKYYVSSYRFLASFSGKMMGKSLYKSQEAVLVKQVG